MFAFVFEGLVCGRMPMLILLNDVFRPAWKLPGAKFKKVDNEDYVCIKVYNPTIIRVGRGWGRRGNDTYYYYDGERLRKLRKRVVKIMGENNWVTCVSEADIEKMCFRLNNGKIVAVQNL